MLVGTDAPVPVVLPGFSEREELQDLVAAGLTPYEALRAATANAAEFLKQAREFGGVAEGSRACPRLSASGWRRWMSRRASS